LHPFTTPIYNQRRRDICIKRYTRQKINRVQYR